MVSLCSTDDAQDEGLRNLFGRRIPPHRHHHHHNLLLLVDSASHKTLSFNLHSFICLFVHESLQLSLFHLCYFYLLCLVYIYTFYQWNKVNMGEVTWESPLFPPLCREQMTEAQL